MESFVRCDNAALHALFPRIRGFLERGVTECSMLGARVRGYRSPDAPSIWLRDYSDMMRAFRWWEKDVKSVVSHFAEMQSARGWIFDYFTQTPEKLPCERENWAKYVRVPVEADVEYRFVKAVWLAWQATGDRAWMKSLLVPMERALEYTRSDPWRWDRRLGLVKRPLTIDTWDFDYTAGGHPWLNFQVTGDTIWGVMHGDNSGCYEAFLLLGRMHAEAGNLRRAKHWAKLARLLRIRANRHCFNGRFYRHFVPLKPLRIPGVDLERQLSLSNPMDINRGMATHEMAVAILSEYRERARGAKAFAEWFSIDPPFPDGIFGDAKLRKGIYCNGGIMPLVGGELARAAFDHGFEEYGADILARYARLTEGGASHLWYRPDGTPASIASGTSPDASPADGWGSAAMLHALMEGLAGVSDTSFRLRSVLLAPRWEAAGVREAEVVARYAASGARFKYTYEHDPARKRIRLTIAGKCELELHLLLPRDATARSLHWRNRAVPFTISRIGPSRYIDARVGIKGSAEAIIEYGDARLAPAAQPAQKRSRRMR